MANIRPTKRPGDADGAADKDERPAKRNG